MDSLCDVFKVERAVISHDKRGERDEKLGERRVYVHEELGLDVFGRELAKVHFVESANGQLSLTRANTLTPHCLVWIS